MEEIDIWRTEFLIERHGDNADLQAAKAAL